MATINAAIVLGTEKIGTVEVDKVANLLLLSDCPIEQLDVLNGPIAVIKEGNGLEEMKLIFFV